jgi:hypothetical protein
VNRAALHGASLAQGAWRNTGKVTSAAPIQPSREERRGSNRMERPASDGRQDSAVDGAPTTRDVKKVVQP